MQKKYFIQGLPDSAKDREVNAFFSLLGPVAELRRQGQDHIDWLLEMKTNQGSRAVQLLNGEGYRATRGWHKPFPDDSLDEPDGN